MSVNIFVRLHLSSALQAVASRDFAGRVAKRKYINKFLVMSADIADAVYNLLENCPNFGVSVPISDDGLPTEERSHRYYFGVAVRRNLVYAARDLKLIEAWTFEALDAVSLELGGRPRVGWKHDFVARLAHTWNLLTRRGKARKP